MPGTTAPLAATTAPPPAVVPASNPVVGGGLPGSVAQTFSTNAMGGPVLSTLPGSVARTNNLGGTVISTLPPNLQVEGGFVVQTSCKGFRLN